jgi:SAM-dependent methyltransferase
VVTGGWEAVWASRPTDLSGGSVIGALLLADGRDTPFGTIDEEAWLAFVRRVAARLGVGPGDSVCDVGCGAGAFLYELHRMGCVVSGVDRSASLIDCARRAMPGRQFVVADADALAAEPAVDAVVSCDAFLYFPSAKYAGRVVDAMAAKARRAVAVIGVPDAATKDEALARRRDLAGGEAAYDARYRGLEHLYIQRDWLVGRMAAAGLVDIEVEDQGIDDDNAAFRFNCFGSVPR